MLCQAGMNDLMKKGLRPYCRVNGFYQLNRAGMNDLMKKGLRRVLVATHQGLKVCWNE